VRRGVGAALVFLLAANTPAAAQFEELVIRGLTFSGNKSIDAATLALSIATTNSAFLARAPVLRGLGLGEKRLLSELQLRRDVQRIKFLYRASGFPDVQVDTVVQRTPENVKIKFVITEGEPIRLSELIFAGVDSVDDVEALTRDLPITPGDHFSRLRLQDATDSLGTRLRDAGYPLATVRLVEGVVDSTRRLRSATLVAIPGRAAVYGDTRVVGMVAIDSHFIASLVTARAGQPYRFSDIYRSQRSLYGSELFRFATVGIDTARFQEGDAVVPMLVTVSEGPFHRARAAVGYGTSDCLRTSAGWTSRNFLGDGRIFDVTGRLSKIGIGDPLDFGLVRSICSPLKEDSIGSRDVNYGLNTSIRRNGFLSPDNTGVFAIFVERRSEFKVYQREEIGASASITRETAARIPITLTYRAAYGETRANDASFCAFFNACVRADIAQLRQRRVLATLTLGASRVRVNNVVDPTRGTTLSAEGALSSQFIGSSRLQQFGRLVAEAAAYVPLTRTIVLAAHVRAGLIIAPRTDIGDGGTNFVPPDQRFYAGGPNDVRGYDRNELGPVVYVVPRDSVQAATDTSALSFPETSARAAPVGGNRLGVANVELRLPSPIFSSRLRFAVFVDAGVLGDGKRGDGGGVRVTPGVGLRVGSPLGPIRFDVGYNRYQLAAGPVYTTNENGDLVLIRENFTRENRGGRWTLHFSVGQAF